MFIFVHESVNERLKIPKIDENQSGKGKKVSSLPQNRQVY